LLKASFSISSPTALTVLCAALEIAAASPSLAAFGATLASAGAASDTSRQMRCTKRCAPSTPASVQITSRSGGESDSMNQRAVSAP
jgi:hypothetical protein